MCFNDVFFFVLSLKDTAFYIFSPSPQFEWLETITCELNPKHYGVYLKLILIIFAAGSSCHLLALVWTTSLNVFLKNGNGKNQIEINNTAEMLLIMKFP